MAKIDLVGSGTSLSAAYYMRRFYKTNTDARNKSTRSDMEPSALSGADALALRRAVKNLGKFEYHSDDSANIRSSVTAFVNTYNNLLDSAASSTDRTLNRSTKSLKQLTSQYKDDLDKLGITVNDDGTLKTRDALFSKADASKFQKLFSKDSDYMKQVTAYAKRAEKQSSSLSLAANAKTTAAAATKTAVTPAAALVSQAASSPTVSDNGIGGHINISI